MRGLRGRAWGLKRCLRRGGEGDDPAEAFAKGGDSDELRGAPSLVSVRYHTLGIWELVLQKIIAEV